MFSTPLICSSSGVATVSETTRGLAPGNWARTTICGGVTSGYSEIGSWKIDSSPIKKMKIDSTAAKRGRSMKKREMSMLHVSVLRDRRGGALRRGDTRGQRHALLVDSEQLRRHGRSGKGAQQAIHHHPLAGLDALDHAHALDQ